MFLEQLGISLRDSNLQPDILIIEKFNELVKPFKEAVNKHASFLPATRKEKIMSRPWSTNQSNVKKHNVSNSLPQKITSRLYKLLNLQKYF